MIKVQGMNTLTALTRALTHWQSERIRGTSNQKVVYVVNKIHYNYSEGSIAVTTCIGVARGGQGRAFALPSLNFALPSKVAKQVN